MFPRSPNDIPPRCLAAESVIRECESSLRRLRTDVIDVYQCHWPDPQVPIRETMSAMTTLLEQGKIRAIGLSNFSCEQIAAAREFGPIHALQPPFSMLQRRAADDLIPYCMENNLGVLAYGPLAKGLLTGKFDLESRHEGIREHDPDFVGRRYRRNLSLVASLRGIASRYDKTAGQLAINWTISQAGVTSAIAGAKRPSQVQENCGGVGWSISQEDMTEIDRLLREAHVGT
jgi:aryl-alcohol dehydrogenase-like predicted oxidoreductase